jgi:hypothetical protein
VGRKWIGLLGVIGEDFRVGCLRVPSTVGGSVDP